MLKLRNKYVEMAAMHAAMAAELEQGCTPRPVYRTKSYDIESEAPVAELQLCIIEVKGLTDGSTDVTLTANEIRNALNKRGSWLLALVHVPYDETISSLALQRALDAGAIRHDVAARCDVRYVYCWLDHALNFGSTRESFNIATPRAQGHPFAIA